MIRSARGRFARSRELRMRGEPDKGKCHRHFHARFMKQIDTDFPAGIRHHFRSAVVRSFARRTLIGRRLGGSTRFDFKGTLIASSGGTSPKYGSSPRTGCMCSCSNPVRLRSVLGPGAVEPDQKSRRETRDDRPVRGRQRVTSMLRARDRAHATSSKPTNKPDRANPGALSETGHSVEEKHRESPGHHTARPLRAGRLCHGIVLRAVWHDEIFTETIARLERVDDVWSALARGTDLNPPLYYLAVAARITCWGKHTCARLPAALGYLLMSVCLYRFVARRFPVPYAWLAMLLPLITQASWYGCEGRPYGLFLGFSAWRWSAGKTRPTGCAGRSPWPDWC